MFRFSSLTTLFDFYSTSTKAQHCTWTENHEFTANVVDADALLYILSFLVWKMLPQDERNSGWGQRFFQICLTTITPRYTTSSNFKSGPSIFSKKHSTNTCRECDVLRQWVDWESIADELKATIPILQGQQQGHWNSTLSNRVQVACTHQRAQQRNKGMAKHHTKSLVYILSIKLRKMLGKYHSTNPEQ